VGNIGSAAVYWKNGTQVVLGDNASFSSASAIAVKDNDVYVAGFSNNNYASYWKNGQDSVLSTTDVGNCSDILLNGNDVYLAGFVGSTGGATYWKNGIAVQLDQGGGSLTANAIAINGADVYISGGDNNGPYGVYWKNGVLNKLQVGTIVNDIAVNENDIYLAGVAPGANAGKNSAVYWKDNTMITLAKVGEAHSIAIVTK
jgi:hypothetical protein